MREDDGGQFDADAEVDAVGEGLEAQLVADGLHPLAAAAADGNNTFPAGMRAGFALDPEAAALDGADVVDGGIEEEVDLLLQLFIEVFQHNEVDVRAEMADGGIEQVELVLDAELFETGAGGGVEFGARAAVGHVDLIDIVHQLERLLLADVLVERAAEVIRDVVLPVGERARAAEAAHDRAGLAFDARFHALAVDGTAALGERMARLENGDLQAAVFLRQLVGGKNAAGASAHDDDIIIKILHSVPPAPWQL